MGDLLVRNIDPDTKKRLSESALANGRSLSDEAALRLKDSLAHGSGKTLPTGQRLRALIGGFTLTDEERSDIASSRHEKDREPPSFGAI